MNSHVDDDTAVGNPLDPESQNPVRRPSGAGFKITMGAFMKSSPSAQTLKQIHELMELYDTDGDGALAPNEILDMHNALLKGQKRSKNLRQVAFLLFIMLCLSVTANFGTSLVANIYTRDTRVLDDIMTVIGQGKRNIVTTSVATTTFPLYLVPLAGLTVINNIQHIQFTTLDVDFTSGVHHSTLQMGVQVKSYQFYNLTTVLLLGSRSEQIMIINGDVRLYGLEGTSGGPISVCPGKSTTAESFAKITMITTEDVDINYLKSKATDYGISTKSNINTCNSVTYN